MTASGFRLPLALLASLLVHGAFLMWEESKAEAPPAKRLDVKLVMPEKPVEKPVEPPPVEPMLKNTLTEQEKPQPQKPAAAPATLKGKPSPQPTPQRLRKAEEQAALRKLSDFVFYPEAAQRAGIEGTVHLLIRLVANGTIDKVSIAASSGYAVLDEAALRGVQSMGRMPNSSTQEFILPVTFRLQ